MTKLSRQEEFRRLLAASKIPHYECKVFGTQIKVVTLREEYKDRWIIRILKIAKVDRVEETTVREKKAPGSFVQPPPVKAWAIYATIKEGNQP